MYFNRMTLIGFLGNDAEAKTTASGKTFTQLSVATKTSWKDTEGEWQSRTEWHRVMVWGERLAAFAGTLKKGTHVHVEGPLHSREYEKDGVQSRVWELKAESILKLDRTERAGQASATADEASATQEPPAPRAEESTPEELSSSATGKSARHGSRRRVAPVPEEAPF
jgi:single-strand DNA-binding protein